MGWKEDQEAQQKGELGTGYVPYGDPGRPQYGEGVRRRHENQQPRAPREPWTIGEYFGALLGGPIVIGAIAAGVGLLEGGDYLRWALVAGGGAFAVVLACGVVWVAVRVFIIALPLAVVAAIALYLLERVGVGPGLSVF